MVAHGGVYYLFYSGNAYDTSRYAVGVAQSASVLGPFTKAPAPILLTGGVGRTWALLGGRHARGRHRDGLPLVEVHGGGRGPWPLGPHRRVTWGCERADGPALPVVDDAGRFREGAGVGTRIARRQTTRVIVSKQPPADRHDAASLARVARLPDILAHLVDRQWLVGRSVAQAPRPRAARQARHRETSRRLLGIEPEPARVGQALERRASFADGLPATRELEALLAHDDDLGGLPARSHGRAWRPPTRGAARPGTRG